jgi:hypothetical protein
MPKNAVFLLFEREGCLGVGPEFGEIIFVALPFVGKVTQELPFEGKMADFRTASPDVKRAIEEGFASDFALEIGGSEPKPRAGEIAAPILVGIAITRHRRHKVARPSKTISPS